MQIPGFIPTPGNIRRERAARRLDGIIYDLIRRRHAAGGQDDLLGMLLSARDEDDGTRMTDQQLRDEAMTLFLAGHDTTALTLSWGWYLLARHPEVAQRWQPKRMRCWPAERRLRRIGRGCAMRMRWFTKSCGFTPRPTSSAGKRSRRAS